MRPQLVKRQKIASWTIGISLIIMAVAAGIAVGSFQSQLWIREDSKATMDAWDATQYNILLLLWLIILVTDGLVSLALYWYYLPKEKRLAQWTSGLRWAYTLILGIAIYQLFPIPLINPSSIKASAILTQWNSFEYIWNLGLIIFGLHLCLWAWTAWNDARGPKWLITILMVAGFAYVIISLLKTIIPFPELANSLNTIFMLPMIVGELGMGIWLLVWGRKTLF